VRGGNGLILVVLVCCILFFLAVVNSGEYNYSLFYNLIIMALTLTQQADLVIGQLKKPFDGALKKNLTMRCCIK